MRLIIFGNIERWNSAVNLLTRYRPTSSLLCFAVLIWELASFIADLVLIILQTALSFQY